MSAYCFPKEEESRLFFLGSIILSIVNLKIHDTRVYTILKQSLDSHEAPNQDDLKDTLKEIGLNDNDIASTVPAILSTLTSFDEAESDSLYLIATPVSSLE